MRDPWHNSEFCSIYYKKVMEEVRQHLTPKEIKEAWGYRYSGSQDVEFHFRDFYWHGEGCCMKSTKAEGWQAWLRKYHPTPEEQKEDEEWELFRNTKVKTKKTCRACGKQVAMFTNGGKIPPHSKRHVRHKCPHGEWCPTGDANWGTHANDRMPPGSCKKCQAARKAEKA